MTHSVSAQLSIKSLSLPPDRTHLQEWGGGRTPSPPQLHELGGEWHQKLNLKCPQLHELGGGEWHQKFNLKCQEYSKLNCLNSTRMKKERIRYYCQPYKVVLSVLTHSASAQLSIKLVSLPSNKTHSPGVRGTTPLTTSTPRSLEERERLSSLCPCLLIRPLRGTTPLRTSTPCSLAEERGS